MFKDVAPFMESVYQCIEKTIEIKIDTLNDFNELLIKNSLMQFIQNYIDYAQLSQKRQIVRLLSDSLDKLQVQPLIINLGLLLKPMYQDENYLENVKKLKEIEIQYTLNNEIEKTIKTDIDNWLRINLITLENQNQFKDELLEYYDFLIEKYEISTESERYLKLKTEVMEMYSMKLTMLSLMETFIDESIEPLPIK
jgi:hypothetical protein